MADEDQISDVDVMLEADQETDVDAASSVLSQSLRSTHSYNGGDASRYYRYATEKKSTMSSSGTNPMQAAAEEVGFLNVAMHHLVQDELLAANDGGGGGSNRSRISQYRQYGRSTNGGVVSSALSGPKRRSRSQADYMSDGSESRYIVTHRKKHKRSDGNINYYDGNRTPSPVI